MLLIANQTPSTLWNAHTHSLHQLSFIQAQIAPLPSTTHITTHLQDHIPLQRFHKTHTDTTHLTTSTLTSKSSHSHQQYKPTYEPRKQQSIDQNHTHQHSITATDPKPQHTTLSTPNIITVSHPIPQLFHEQFNQPLWTSWYNTATNQHRKDTVCT